jgi:hypothetical protein
MKTLPVAHCWVLLFALLVSITGEKTDGFNSVFVGVDENLPGYPWHFERAQWDETMRLLSDIGVNQIILSNCVSQYSAHYPSKLPGYKVVSNSTVKDVLEAAQQKGIDVWLGILNRDAWYYNGRCTNPTYLSGLLSEMSAISKELFSLYGHIPSFNGLYNTAELWSECCDGPCSSSQASLTGKLFIEPLGKVVKDLRPGFMYTMAPYFQNDTAPTDQVNYWQSVLRFTPSVDVIMFQDGVGVQHVDGPKQAAEYIRPLSKMVRENFGYIKFWTDVEIFQKYPLPRAPARWDRILEQIEHESPFVSGMTLWEFYSYMDPRNPHASPVLYDQYKTWHEVHNSNN